MRNANRMPEQLTLFLSVAMAMAYLGGGIGLIASSQSFGILPTGPIRYGMAVLLIIYGAFRAIRAYQQAKRRD